METSSESDTSLDALRVWDEVEDDTEVARACRTGLTAPFSWGLDWPIYHNLWVMHTYRIKLNRLEGSNTTKNDLILLQEKQSKNLEWQQLEELALDSKRKELFKEKESMEYIPESAIWKPPYLSIVKGPTSISFIVRCSVNCQPLWSMNLLSDKIDSRNNPGSDCIIKYRARSKVRWRAKRRSCRKQEGS